MIKDWNIDNICDIEPKAGMVIQLIRRSDNTIHNMVLVPLGEVTPARGFFSNVADYGDKGQKTLILWGALEQFCCGDEKITFGRIGDSYCDLNFNAFPKTYGIDPAFGDEVCEIYPHLGYCDTNETIYKMYKTGEYGMSQYILRS